MVKEDHDCVSPPSGGKKLAMRAGWAFALASVLALTACGGGSDFGPAAGPGAATSSESVLSSLPADAQTAYETLTR